MGVLRRFSFCLLLLVLILPDAYGSGFTFDGLGVKARGMGGAFRALADDWSAAYYNPAGYNRIQDNMLAGNVALFHNRYSANPDVHRSDEDTLRSGFFNGREIYNRHEVLNVPQGAILARLPVWGETVFGLSILQLFDQNQSWELFMNIPEFNPTSLPDKQFYNNLDVVAFQLTAARGFMDDRLSVGVGLAVLRGDLIFNSLVLRDNPIEEISYRPYDKITKWYSNDGKGWGFGYRAGLLYGLNDKIDLGLVYTGKSSIDLSGETDFLFYLPDNPTEAQNYFETSEEYYFLDGNVEDVSADFEATLDIPASIGGGIAFKANERLTLALDAEMIFWSQFEGFEFKYTNYRDLPNPDFETANAFMTQDVSVPIEWDNAGRVMFGANYKLRDFVDLRTGFSLDQSPVKEETFIPQFIDLGDKYSFSFGIGFEAGFWHLDLASTYTHHPELDVADISDFDSDGLMDNLSALYKADNYLTVLGISYRF